MKKIRIGVLGCANIAKKAVIPAIKSMEEFDLVAIASRTLEKANMFASLFGCEAIEGYHNLISREDIDALYIPLPTGLHEESVLASLESGKHVLVEKSLAIDATSAEIMVSKARVENLLLMENFMFKYHRQLSFIRNLLIDGEIGIVRVLKSSFGFPPLDEQNIRYKKELGGGSLLDAGAYTVKAAQLFLGTDLQVKASHLYYDREKRVDIRGAAFLVSDQGQVAQISFGFDNYYQCNIELWGSNGKITADRIFTAHPGYSPKVKVEKEGDTKEFLIDLDNHFVNLLKDFHKKIAESDFENEWAEIINQARLLNSVRELCPN